LPPLARRFAQQAIGQQDKILDQFTLKRFKN
jgi:hypothetical protein